MLGIQVSGALLNFMMSMQWPKWLYHRICFSIVSQEIHIFLPTSFKELPCAHLLGMPPMQISVMLASTMLKSPVYNCKVHFRHRVQI